jgi:mannose-6-phosphate isomerase-like protein (cupin superfamily)
VVLLSLLSQSRPAAPDYHHTCNEVVHVLAGLGAVHLDGGETEIGPGTSIYLPPLMPHCRENTGSVPVQVQVQVLGSAIRPGVRPPKQTP